MASYGYTFNSGDGVTPTRLNAARTVGDIVNADIASSAAIEKTKISGTAITAADTGTVTSAMIADGAIVNADINNSAAIAHSKLANITSGQVLLGNASNVPTATAVTGDVTISDTGVTAISTGVIVDADVNAAAGIADTKLATISTEGKVANSATTATSANTASAIVARDASGNFSAGTITAALSGNATGSSGSCTGNAATATTWATARNLSLTGDVTATLSSVNGSANVSAAATIANNAVTAAKLNGAQTGSAPIYGCRAWVYFDGQTDSTGNSNTNNTNRQILGSGNVSSVTKTGQGAFTVNFTTAMGGSNYAAVITHHSTISGSALTRFVAKNSSDFQFITTDAGGTASNAKFVNVLIFE